MQKIKGEINLWQLWIIRMIKDLKSPTPHPARQQALASLQPTAIVAWGISEHALFHLNQRQVWHTMLLWVWRLYFVKVGDEGQSSPWSYVSRQGSERIMNSKTNLSLSHWPLVESIKKYRTTVIHLRKQTNKKLTKQTNKKNIFKERVCFVWFSNIAIKEFNQVDFISINN